MDLLCLLRWSDRSDLAESFCHPAQIHLIDESLSSHGYHY